MNSVLRMRLELGGSPCTMVLCCAAALPANFHPRPLSCHARRTIDYRHRHFLRAGSSADHEYMVPGRRGHGPAIGAWRDGENRRPPVHRVHHSIGHETDSLADLRTDGKAADPRLPHGEGNQGNQGPRSPPLAVVHARRRERHRFLGRRRRRARPARSSIASSSRSKAARKR